MQRVRLAYSKGEELKFIGHLDMVRLWERALRRTDLPAEYTQGFNPRQHLGFGPPLSLGIASDHELLDIYFETWANPDAVMAELNRVLPDGIRIIEAKNIYSGIASITASITTAQYEADFEGNIQEKIKTILDLNEIMVKRKDKQVNIRPMIKDVRIENGKLLIKVQCDNFGTLKAGEILGLFDGRIKHLKRVKLF